MTNAGRETDSTHCPHLGFANDPFNHLSVTSDEHRCYLWMQRDRIDPDHQLQYCLTSNFRLCPWLQISQPGSIVTNETWRQRLLSALPEGSEGRGEFLANLALRAAVTSGRLALFLAQWARATLPQVTAWISRELYPAATATVRAVAKAIRPVATPRPTKIGQKQKLEEAIPGDDFSLLMRLGREANLAGRRQEARIFFSRAVAIDANSEEAWLWMAATAEDPQEAQANLQRLITINPESGRGRTQLGEPARIVPQRGLGDEEAETAKKVSAPLLLKQGIQALDSGDESRAYELFTIATEQDASNEAAWFWRAKTATNLDELATSLERVIELNPDNGKAQANLDWAKDRQSKEAERHRQASMKPMAPTLGTFYSEPPPPHPMPFLMDIGSLAYLFLGLLWLGPVVLSFLDEDLASLYRQALILPSVRLPGLPSSILGNLGSLIPEFNLYYLAPLFIALNCFIAMESSASGRRTVTIYLGLVSLASIIATGLFVVGNASTVVLVGISLLAAVSALVGRAIYHRPPSPTTAHP
ncbi:MAG: hypothetical protein HYU86_03340 [Chloroflexi bacterium]|nr:hypothetical protein [Chloroflexota bacterium]